MERLSLGEHWQIKEPEGFLDGFNASREGRELTLPHDEMIDAPRSPQSPNGPAGAWYTGGTWTFIRKLHAEADWLEKFVFLEFEGVSANASVFINGEFAGQCPSPYAGFAVPIHPFLRKGENELKVVAKCGMQQIGRWYVGGGMLRPVSLLTGGRVCVAPWGVRVTTLEADERQAVLRAEVRLISGGTGRVRGRLRLKVLSRDGGVCASDEQPFTLLPPEAARPWGDDPVTDMWDVPIVSRLLVSDPALWSVDTPSMYTLQAEVSVDGEPLDKQRIHFGIRTISVDSKRGLRLNGSEIKLRGACVHSDNGMLGGVSLPDYEARRVRRLKAAGFNAIRSAHNPASRALLDACDRAGMLVMDELFDVWNISKSEHDGSMTFSKWWPFEMRAMADKDFNHPSVIMYAIGNEIPETGTPAGAALSRAMSARLRRLDPTRLVVSCVNGMFSVMPRMRGILSDVTGGEREIPGDINAMMTMFDAHMDEIMRHPVVTEATEEAFAGVDVCGYNYMDSRYETDAALYPNRAIVGSETTPRAIGNIWPRITRLPHVLGDFCWTGWEYLGEAGVGKNDYDLTHAMYGPWPWYLAYCGDFDLCGNRRPQSYYREIVYGLRKAPYIAVERPENYGRPRSVTNWTWPDVVESWTWHGFEGRPVHVEVYGDADEAALLLNGMELARSAIGGEVPYKALFDITYQPGELRCVLCRKGKAAEQTALRTAGKPAKLLLIPEETERPADGESLFFLNIRVADERGDIVPCANNDVHMEVDGAECDARLASADPRSSGPFLTKDCKAFDGRALIILRTGHESGEITVSVSSPGLTGASAALRALAENPA